MRQRKANARGEQRSLHAYVVNCDTLFLFLFDVFLSLLHFSVFRLAFGPTSFFDLSYVSVLLSL